MVDYSAIALHLITPLIEFPEQVAVDCETTASGRYVFVRVAVAETDREKVTGKNGRTISMVRTILGIAAQNAGQGADLNLFGDQSEPSSRKPRRQRPRS